MDQKPTHKLGDVYVCATFNFLPPKLFRKEGIPFLFISLRGHRVACCSFRSSRRRPGPCMQNGGAIVKRNKRHPKRRRPTLTSFSWPFAHHAPKYESRSFTGPNMPVLPRPCGEHDGTGTGIRPAAPIPPNYHGRTHNDRSDNCSPHGRTCGRQHQRVRQSRSAERTVAGMRRVAGRGLRQLHPGRDHRRRVGRGDG